MIRNLAGLVALGGLWLLSSGAQAAIVYLDATSGVGGNTTLAGGGTFSPGGSASGTDGLWRARSFTDGSGTVNIVEAAGETGATPQNNEDAPQLKTTITGLTPGASYNLYAYYWTALQTTTFFHDWRVNAGLTPSSLTLFNSGALDQGGMPQVPTGTQVLDASGFTAPVVVSQADRRLWQGAIGVGVADGSGSIDIYIDDDNVPAPLAGTGSSQWFRTWYDGVGYEPVPEPSSAVVALMFVSAASVMAVRKRMG